MVGTYDGFTMRTYLNGNPDTVDNLGGVTAVSWAGQSLQMGKASWYENYFNGALDDVMIFNKVLSEEEVTAIYENQRK